MSPQRIVHHTIIILLLLLHPPPFTSARVDDDPAIDNIHEQHAHLKPENYGHGLRQAETQDQTKNTDTNIDETATGHGLRRPGRQPLATTNDTNIRSSRRRPARSSTNTITKETRNKKKKKKKKKKRKKKKKKPNNKPTTPSSPNNNPTTPSSPNNNPTTPSSPSSSAKLILDHLSTISKTIDNELFLYEEPSGAWLPSTVYKHEGLSKGLKVMNAQGVAGMYYYLGEDEGGGRALQSKAYQYGLTNVAAFLAQSMKETIKYNACDENNWDMENGGYALSNSCGQLGQSYEDYTCPKGEEHMACDVDSEMEIVAVTHATWYGAPAPLFCRPKKNKNDFTGKWNYGKECNLPWANPPQFCDIYEGQKAGGFENDVAVASKGGRTDTEGCCWWGRGVIQTTGICNFGKLNYYLGARAAREGRSTPYSEIDFCKDPEAICANTKYTELKWIAGMLYWMESVQQYDSEDGWNYMSELRKFVDGGFVDRGFIDSVSGIVNRGCHDPPCGTGALDGGSERYDNFIKTLKAFKLLDSP